MEIKNGCPHLSLAKGILAWLTAPDSFRTLFKKKPLNQEGRWNWILAFREKRARRPQNG